MIKSWKQLCFNKSGWGRAHSFQFSISNNVISPYIFWTPFLQETVISFQFAWFDCYQFEEKIEFRKLSMIGMLLYTKTHKHMHLILWITLVIFSSFCFIRSHFKSNNGNNNQLCYLWNLFYFIHIHTYTHIKWPK